MVDKLNQKAYWYHYKNLDSTYTYAKRALELSSNYDEGKAEAFNHLAFVNIAKMKYREAYALLDTIKTLTDSQIELLIADVQCMRLCQRQSRNKDFYYYQDRALKRIKRIDEELNELNSHQLARMIFARSEYCIVSSTYYYYVGLMKQSIEALHDIRPDGELQRDTAQLLAYWYNMGTGGLDTQQSKVQTNQVEFEYLMRCLFLAVQANYPYWEANSMQAISEHLLTPAVRNRLIADNKPAIDYINVDNMPDSLLAGNLAERALGLFRAYGDVYQIAGANRTLSECYWAIADYRSALICLNAALHRDTTINQAPDLVASIREQLSIVYASVNDKVNSDYNRNLYLDKQEQTRQDRYLESRAEQLDNSSRQLNVMIAAVLIMIFLTTLLIWFFDRMRQKSERTNSIRKLIEPLERWKSEQQTIEKQIDDDLIECEEKIALVRNEISSNWKRNLEQKSKLGIVSSVIPFIDRIIHEVQQLTGSTELPQRRQERYAYIIELTDKINQYNNVLTRWIQLRQGSLRLHIESFPLQPLFDIVAKGKTGFTQKGIHFQVDDTNAVVKADKALTLFMINTLTDNARKFTDAGGRVHLSARSLDDVVEITIADSGQGMTEEQVAHLFDVKPVTDEFAVGREGSHGFGLANCKGIIEKYKKTSKIFQNCTLQVNSAIGTGSVFKFTLPKGIIRTLNVCILLLSCAANVFGVNPSHEKTWGTSYTSAKAYADSAYHSNIRGTYEKTLIYADSAIYYINRIAEKQFGRSLKKMVLYDARVSTSPELIWAKQTNKLPYAVILDVRNEVSISALALHDWNLYRYNNRVYTSLFREISADTSLPNYVQTLQKSETNKNVAISILVLLFILIFPAYYFLYYRHRMYYNYCVERVDDINKILLSNMTVQQKLQRINELTTSKFISASVHDGIQKLNQLIDNVKDELYNTAQLQHGKAEQMEMLNDELRKANYENDQLHISNNVLDNCLSALKHETMYYPSRIQRMAQQQDAHITDLQEVTVYYKELYMMLYQQALRQASSVKFPPRTFNFSTCSKIGNLTFSPTPYYNVQVQPQQPDVALVGNPHLLEMLFELLWIHNKRTKPNVIWMVKDAHYMRLQCHLNLLQLDEDACKQLFTPLTVDVDFLLCKQIVREIGDDTNARGCGAVAHPAPNGGTFIELTLVYKFNKNRQMPD